MTEYKLEVRFFTPTGKFLPLDRVEVDTLDQAKALVLSRYPTAKMVNDGDGQIRFTVNGRNVAFTDDYYS